MNGFGASFSGEKSDDPEHPAYLPTLFAFVPPTKKRKLETSLSRHARALGMAEKRQAAASGHSPESTFGDEDGAMAAEDQGI